MDVQPTNLQQLRDAIMSIWTNISEECFQHLVEFMPQIIKAVLKAKGVVYWTVICKIINNHKTLAHTHTHTHTYIHT